MDLIHSNEEVKLNNVNVNNINVNLKLKLYKLRWLILILFFLNSSASAMQWVQYSIITNIIMRYYNVSSIAVNWTTVISMLLYPLLIIPGCYFIDKKGLRICTLSGIIGTATGTWIKVFSVSPDKFWVGFLGQIIVFVAQVFILSLPAKVAAVWFGKDEVSTATSIGVVGSQFGTAIGFILPSLLVKNHENLDDIGKELSLMFNSVAIFTVPLVILCFTFFKPEPEVPPSVAQAYQRLHKLKITRNEYWKSYKELLTNKSYLLLIISSGINVGYSCAFFTLLNQFILSYFEGGEKDAGQMGLLLVITGMFGGIFFGVTLDKTKRFKECTVTLYVITVIGILIFALALETKSKLFVYVTISIVGVCQGACCPVSFEFAAELTYPQPESTSSGIMMSFGQGFGVIFTLTFAKILDNSGTFWTIILIIPTLIVSVILTVLIPNDLRRQNVGKVQGDNEEIESL